MVRFPPTDIPAAEIPEAIRPFLNPEYWDGHVLGDDSGAKPPEATSRACGQLAVEALSKTVRLGSQNGSLNVFETGEVYEAGSTFTSDEHEPGTVLLFNKEELYRPRSIGGYANMAQLGGTDLPPPPTSLHVDFSLPSSSRWLQENTTGAGIEYRHSVHIGIVALDHRDRNRVFSVSTSQANQSFWKPEIVELATTWGSHAEPEPISIGEVQHYSGRRADVEMLTRVNILVANAMADIKEAVRSTAQTS